MDQTRGPGGQRCEETVASSMARKFQQLPQVSEHIEMKWPLFRTAMILLSVESGLEWRWVARKKQDFKEAIRTKMLLRPCCKAGHHLICNPGIPRCKKMQL